MAVRNRRKFLADLAKLHDDWVMRWHLAVPVETDNPHVDYEGRSEYGQQHVDVSAPPHIEAEFQRQLTQLLNTQTARTASAFHLPGRHDQQRHAGAGGGIAGSGFNEISLATAVEMQLPRLQGATRESLTDLMAGSTFYARDQHLIDVNDPDGLIAPQLLDEVLVTTGDLIDNYPPPYGLRMVIQNFRKGKPAGAPRQPAGLTMRGKPVISLNTQYMSRSYVGATADEGRFAQPLGEEGEVSYTSWVVAHEYGHSITPLGRDGYGAADSVIDRAVWVSDNHPNALGSYARQGPDEAFAEAFADWYHSGGATENPATLAYQSDFGWAVPE